MYGTRLCVVRTGGRATAMAGRASQGEKTASCSYHPATLVSVFMSNGGSGLSLSFFVLCAVTVFMSAFVAPSASL